MDPLSITASIIAVIQLTSSVISAAYNYRNGVKNAPEGAVKIVDDLTGLSQILEKLLKLIEKDRSTGSALLRTVSSPFHPEPVTLCCTSGEVSQ
jgi:ankyrin repeat domain-containing protein 50